jgi:SPP1 family predicted phage head-tail adaptor
MTLAAGRMRDRIVIQTKSVTRDSYGAEVVTWGTLATVWAAVESLSGREYMASQSGVDQPISMRTVRVVIRYREDVMPHMRITHEGRTLLIQAILKRGNDEQLDLMCVDVNEATA